MGKRKPITTNALLREDARTADELGISYGVFKGYQATGYLDTYVENHASEIAERRKKEKRRKQIREKYLRALTESGVLK